MHCQLLNTVSSCSGSKTPASISHVRAAKSGNYCHREMRSGRATDTPCGAIVAAPGDPLCCRWRSALTRRRSSRLARRCSMLLTSGEAFAPAAVEAGDWVAGTLPGGEDCLPHSVRGDGCDRLPAWSHTFARTRLWCKEPGEPFEISTRMPPIATHQDVVRRRCGARQVFCSHTSMSSESRAWWCCCQPTVTARPRQAPSEAQMPPAPAAGDGAVRWRAPAPTTRIPSRRLSAPPQIPPLHSDMIKTSSQSQHHPHMSDSDCLAASPV